MEHRVLVTYDRQMIAAAARQYSLRAIPWYQVVAFLVVLGLLTDLVLTGDRSWLVGAVAVILGLAAAVGVATFVVPYRRAMARFKLMASPTGEFVFSEAGVTVASELGRQELDWKLIPRVWRFERFWMLF